MQGQQLGNALNAAAQVAAEAAEWLLVCGGMPGGAMLLQFVPVPHLGVMHGLGGGARLPSAALPWRAW